MTAPADIFLVDKPEGLTPLQALGKFREKFPQHSDKKITYAGRLDPMASGLLLFLSGPAILEKEKYLNLPKQYSASILLGFETDSFDTLGLVTNTTADLKEISTSNAQEISGSFTGTPMLSLPPYSSPPLNGTPLHALARKGLINAENSPKRLMQFDAIETQRVISISGEAILEAVANRIAEVTGDFRQEEIVSKWREAVKPAHDYQLIQLTVQSQSGAYIRSLAHAIGRGLGMGAVLYELRRERIGGFGLDQSIKLV